MIVSAQELKSLALDKNIILQSCGDYFALERVLEETAKSSEAAGDFPTARAFRLLSHLCLFSLRTNDGDTFSPRFQIDGKRSPLPIDFVGEQTIQLADAIDTFIPPLLLARVADTVWYNDRSRWQIALKAIDAYCKCTKQLLSGAIRSQFSANNEIDFDAFTYFERALEIAAQANRKDPFPIEISGTFEELYKRTSESPEFIGFARMADIAGRTGFRTWEQVSLESVDVATKADARNIYPISRQKIWEIAATAFRQQKNKEQERICCGKVADAMLSMRSYVSGAAAQAAWTMDAIGYLRNTGGFKTRIEELILELRALQIDALSEMGTFEYSMDLTNEWEEIKKAFSDLSLSKALRLFVGLVPTPKISELNDRATKEQESFLQSHFSSHHVDEQGKIISITPSADKDGKLNQEWLKAQRSHNLSFDRQYYVTSRIEPARRIFTAKFPVGTYCFDPIVEASPFVPPGHEFIFSLGFSSFFQGDYVRAAYILIPQLEASLRYLLEVAGTPSDKIKADLLQEDRSLSGILTNMRSQVENLFGPDLTEEIDLLFHHKPGPSLRHEMAHGKFTTGHCYHDDAIYSCWWIYRMTATPLLLKWQELIEDRLTPSEG